MMHLKHILFKHQLFCFSEEKNSIGQRFSQLQENNFKAM